MHAQNQEEIKIRNRNRVIRLLVSSAPVSRVDLARQTGLTKMTVSNIVSELIAENTVQETGTAGNGPGRRAIGLDIADDAGLILGLYISRRFLRGFLCTLKGKFLAERVLPLSEETNSSLTEKLYRITDALTAESPNLAAVGISCLGPLDPNQGILLSPPHFGKVADLPIRALLKQRFDVPVFLDNDMNTSALAEKFFGSAKEDRNFIYLGVSDGIGAGIYLNGQLYRGSHGQSGEIGHVSVDRSGPVCSCGNQGCLELYASIPPGFQDQTEEEQRALIRTISPYLASGSISLINLFDPDKIFLGHDIAAQGQFAAECIRREIAGKYLGAEQKTVAILPSAHGLHSPGIGAAALCVEQLFPV